MTAFSSLPVARGNSPCPHLAYPQFTLTGRDEDGGETKEQVTTAVSRSAPSQRSCSSPPLSALLCPLPRVVSVPTPSSPGRSFPGFGGITHGPTPGSDHNYDGDDNSLIACGPAGSWRYYVYSDWPATTNTQSCEIEAE